MACPRLSKGLGLRLQGLSECSQRAVSEETLKPESKLEIFSHESPQSQTLKILHGLV